MEIQVAQVIFQAINFFVVLGALGFLLIKPVTKILDKRAQNIADAQKAAQETLAEKEKLDSYKAKVKKEADLKAAEVVAKAKEKAKAKEQELLAQAKEKAKSEIEKLTIEWKKNQAKEQTKLKKEFEKAVIKTAEKVIGSSLDSKKHAALIDQELETLLKTI